MFHDSSDSEDDLKDPEEIISYVERQGIHFFEVACCKQHTTFIPLGEVRVKWPQVLIKFLMNVVMARDDSSAESEDDDPQASGSSSGKQYASCVCPHKKKKPRASTSAASQDHLGANPCSSGNKSSLKQRKTISKRVTRRSRRIARNRRHRKFMSLLTDEEISRFDEYLSKAIPKNVNFTFAEEQHGADPDPVPNPEIPPEPLLAYAIQDDGVAIESISEYIVEDCGDYIILTIPDRDTPALSAEEPELDMN